MSTDGKELKQLGKNSANEFFETIIYMTAYNEARDRISTYTEDIENPILKEATESAINIAAFGGIFMIIKYEEIILDKAFAIAESVIAMLLVLPKKYIGKLKNRMLRGRKLGIVSKMLSGFSDDAVGKSQVISTQLGNFISGRNNQYQSANLVESTLKTRDNVVKRDMNSMTLGNNMANSYTQSLMFKLMSSSFTAKDKDMLKKILGRDTASEFDVEDMNKVGEFMFTKDDKGNMTGLSEQFFQLVNGLGYVHGKS